MKATEILGYVEINPTDPARVAALVSSIRENGWQGAPILVCEDIARLITGSHRLAALAALYEEDFDLDSLGDVAEPVDDIIDNWCTENDTYFEDIRFDFLSEIFAGTWVEQYKDELEEW